MTEIARGIIEHFTHEIPVDLSGLAKVVQISFCEKKFDERWVSSYIENDCFREFVKNGGDPQEYLYNEKELENISIYVNSDHSPFHKRHAIASSLAYILLGHMFFRPSLSLNYYFISTELNKKELKEVEEIAEEILLPKKAFSELVKRKYFTKKVILEEENLKALAEECKISTSFLRNRLEKYLLDFVSPNPE